MIELHIDRANLAVLDAGKEVSQQGDAPADASDRAAHAPRGDDFQSRQSQADPRRRAALDNVAVAAVFIHKASIATSSPPEIVAQTFKLTMAELRVLFAIVEVGGVPEVADVPGITPTTVRTHLSRVYEKTRVSRQADLVKLVAGFVSPLSV